jgi:hypothetical protein
MITPSDDDDVLPEQRGMTPLRADLAKRYELELNRMGRRGRLRSWATILVAVLAIAACAWFFMRSS